MGGGMYTRVGSSPRKSQRPLTAERPGFTARPHSLQSLAMVLLDAHAFKLPRNNSDDRCAEFLALALVDGRRRRRRD